MRSMSRAALTVSTSPSSGPVLSRQASPNARSLLARRVDVRLALHRARRR